MLSLFIAKWSPLWVKKIEDAWLCNCKVDAIVVLLSDDAIITLSLFISIVITFLGVGKEAISIVNCAFVGILIPLTWNPTLTLET